MGRESEEAGRNAMTLVWREEALTRSHDRRAFDCGEPVLNDYLRRYARQNHESGGAKTFVAVSPEYPTRILGYYSVCPASLDYEQTPEVLRRGLGRYDAPVFRLARLAVDRTIQGQGLGTRLLVFAGMRCLAVAKEVGGIALLIDAKNEQVATWYEKYGAIALSDTPLTLILPLSVIETYLTSGLLM
jgi:GNAT superfamily N-acetyltransferase